MKYRDHVKRWQDCGECELCEQRSYMVFARGKVPCDVLFVGEAPGSSEDKLATPFIGKAGHLFDGLLDRGLDPSLRVLITNLVCCYPREAKRVGINEPPKQAIKACGPRLQELYDLCRCRAVICVGKLSKAWLPKVVKLHESTIVVSVIHPASILRMDISQRSLAEQRCLVTLEELSRELVG